VGPKNSVRVDSSDLSLRDVHRDWCGITRSRTNVGSVRTEASYWFTRARKYQIEPGFATLRSAQTHPDLDAALVASSGRRGLCGEFVVVEQAAESVASANLVVLVAHRGWDEGPEGRLLLEGTVGPTRVVGP
jgi:hypothetical protein